MSIVHNIEEAYNKAISSNQALDADGDKLKKYRFVRMDATSSTENAVVYSANSANVLGVTMCTSDGNDTRADIQTQGVALVEASAAIAAGQEIGAGANGTAVVEAGTGLIALNDAAIGSYVSFHIK